MHPARLTTSTLLAVLWLLSAVALPTSVARGQGALPTPAQLDQLLAPIALYPDQLVAQICAASTDPQQIMDVHAWLQQNPNLQGQARTDAAQSRGFDPAFIALVSFPQILDMMASNIDDYAAIGQAFSANQATVMDSIQRLRQQAYASGALQSNQYQTVAVQNQGPNQVIVIQPASPQVVYVPQYNPQVVYQQPSSSEVVATTLLTFGAGIALGAWITDMSHPWGWGGWGWNWGRGTVVVNNNTWVVNNRYRPPYSSYHYRPPAYNRPVYVRPPTNWQSRPYYRPAGGRPPGPAPGYAPGRPSPPPARPLPAQPAPGYRPPPPQQGYRPGGANRPTPSRPSPYAGYPGGAGNAAATSGGRTNAFSGSRDPAADRAAMSRGRASVASERAHGPGGHRR